MALPIARVVGTSNVEVAAPVPWQQTSVVTNFHIRCKQGDAQWMVERRYSEFRALHADISNSHMAGRLPELPPKLLFNASENVAERLEALDAYLRGLLQAAPTGEAYSHLARFLAVPGEEPQPPPEPAQPDGGEEGGQNGDDDTDGDDEEDADDSLRRASTQPELPPSDRGEAGQEGMRPAAWMLSGTWTSEEEERTEDSGDDSASWEPLMKALGTPSAVRRALRGVRVTMTLRHTPGVLMERASSALGEGPPTTLRLDGVERAVPMAGAEGLRRAREEGGAVIIETRLPHGKGCMVDTRRVLPCAERLLRVVELRPEAEEAAAAAAAAAGGSEAAAAAARGGSGGLATPLRVRRVLRRVEGGATAQPWLMADDGGGGGADEGVIGEAEGAAGGEAEGAAVSSWGASATTRVAVGAGWRRARAGDAREAAPNAVRPKRRRLIDAVGWLGPAWLAALAALLAVDAYVVAHAESTHGPRHDGMWRVALLSSSGQEVWSVPLAACGLGLLHGVLAALALASSGPVQSSAWLPRLWPR